MAPSNEEWIQLVDTKIAEVLADQTSSPAPLASISSPDDPNFAPSIDHTLLKPDATSVQIDELCDQAIKYKFKSCCVNGANVKHVAQRLAGTSVVPCAVVGFPLGAGTSSSKAFETTQAISDGAKEIDMVINIGALKSKNYTLLYHDIRAVVGAARSATSPIIVKVILETVFLTDHEKIAASFIAAEAGADFVKTCTGFLGGGATGSDVELMRRTVLYKEGKVKVKASAGVRTFEKCLEMFRAGAERIGTSSGAAIMQQAQDSSTY
ncbi:hypothetical protein AX16_005343 [Volvariella volvacea WC 439]|nr:hypothetical protein AX16_005343 [Volvariella volvacea WC 439]